MLVGDNISRERGNKTTRTKTNFQISFHVFLSNLFGFYSEISLAYNANYATRHHCWQKKKNNKRKQFKTPKFKFNYFDYHLVTGLIQLDWPLLVSAVRNVGRSLIIGRNWAAMQQRSREIPSGQSTRGSPQPPNSNDKWRLANQNKKREHVINYRRI